MPGASGTSRSAARSARMASWYRPICAKMAPSRAGPARPLLRASSSNARPGSPWCAATRAAKAAAARLERSPVAADSSTLVSACSAAPMSPSDTKTCDATIRAGASTVSCSSTCCAELLALTRLPKLNSLLASLACAVGDSGCLRTSARACSRSPSMCSTTFSADGNVSGAG